jgi:hypothetical protein
MSSIRLQVTELILAALHGNTNAYQNIFYGKDWPTDEAMLANGVLLVFAQKEKKERIPSGQLQYRTTFTIDILARVARGGPETTLNLVNILTEQVSTLIITDPAIHRLTNYAPSVEIDIGMTSQGQMQVGQALIAFSYEYTEIFNLTSGTPIKNITSGAPGGFGSFTLNLPQNPAPTSKA